MAQSPLKDTTQPVDSEEEGRSSTMDRRWLIERSLTVVVVVEEVSIRPLFYSDLMILAHFDCITNSATRFE